MAARDVFKFLMVRPATTIDPETDQQGFIRIPDDVLKANGFAREAIDHVGSGKSLNEIRPSAVTYLASSEAIRGFSTRDQTVRSFYSLLVAVRRTEQLTVSGFCDLVQGKLGAAPSGLLNDQTFTSVHARMWNSLYARFVAGNEVREDLTDLCSLLRLAFAITGASSPDFQDDELRVRLKASPVIDASLLSVAKAGGTTASAALTSDADSRKEAAVTALNAYSALENAIEEVRSGEQRSTTILVAQEVGSTGNGGTDDSRSVSLPQSLHTQVTDKLSSTTRSLIRDLGIDPTAEAASDIVETLRERARGSALDLMRLGGVGLVERARRSLANGLSNGTSASPDWLDDLFTNGVVDDAYDASIFSSLGSVKPIGVGDLQVLKETLLKYAMGEVAYIENVMRSESRQRVHRRLEQIEETTTTETTTETSTERDLQTTERYELQTETSKTIDTNSSLDAGMTVSGSYGPVKVSASADYSTSTAKSEAASSSTTYAQEIVDESISSIVESVREERTVTTLEETEETNTHGFDNTAGTEHVVGVYRWVDKQYQAQIYNYGRRLMFEFVVPDPAAFYRFVESGGGADQEDAPTAPEPLPEGFSPQSITETNYETYVATYSVQDVDPPPSEFSVVNRVYSMGPMIPEKDKGSTVSVKEDNTVSVPTGYKAMKVNIRKTSQSLDYFDDYNPQEDAVFRALVGWRYFDLLDDASQSDTLDGETGTVGVVLRTVNLSSYAASVDIICERMEETLDAWRIDVFEKVVAAYNAAKDSYDTAVAAAENVAAASKQSYEESVYREIEQTELKKQCLTLLTDQYFAEFDAMVDSAGDEGYPELDVSEAMDEGPYIQFFEQAFDWANMTYLFYPYFWAKKSHWPERMDPSASTDVTFSQFLRAGAARVLVPVRPETAYWAAVLHYLNTGEIWMGGEVPTIDNPLYVSIVQELKEATEDLSESAQPVGDPWNYTLPTNLVILQEDSSLPDWTTGT